MNPFSYVWQIYLYQPLVNLLIHLYNTIANQNLGWAVVDLTIALRLALLPFSILSERNKVIYQKMEEQIIEAERVHRSDPVYIKEYIRGLMKKYKMHPWAKTGELAIQLLVLVLLYQVFITGIQGLQLSKILYSSVEYPGRLNTVFFSAGPYTFDIGQHSVIWAAIVGLILFIDILISLKKTSRKLSSSDLTYLILFPVASFLILWWLPMVKALFILTSILFSYVLSLARIHFWNKKK